LLIVTTAFGTTLAIDAATGEQIWTQQANGPAPIMGAAPAIDPNRQFVYAAGMDGKVHKYNIGDGSEVIDATWPQPATLKPALEKISSALVFATAANGRTYLYATTSNFGYDLGDYQGHVTAIDIGSGARTVFNALCSDVTSHLATAPATPACADSQAGIWGRPGVVYNAMTDRIYIATGNGPFTAAVGGHDWGESVLALAPDLATSSGARLPMPLDSYTPVEYEQLNLDDDDLGVESPVILPAPADSRIANLGVQIGKDGIVRLLDLDDMSGQGGSGKIGGEISLTTSLDYRGGLNTQPAVWIDPASGIPWLIAVYKSTVHAFFAQANARGRPQLVEAWNIPTTGGTSPVVADGVVFFVAQTNQLVALDARTGTQLWSSAVTGVHWASPIVVNGVVYLTDNDATLRAYAAPPLAAITGAQQALPTNMPKRSATSYAPSSIPYQNGVTGD
jgi:outer membrane protein assembly factor BamB